MKYIIQILLPTLLGLSSISTMKRIPNTLAKYKDFKLYLNIVEGSFKKADDYFVEVKCGDATSITKTEKQTKAPKWNQLFRVPFNSCTKLDLKVWDLDVGLGKDEDKKNDMVGTLSIPIEEVCTVQTKQTETTEKTKGKEQKQPSKYENKNISNGVKRVTTTEYTSEDTITTTKTQVDELNGVTKKKYAVKNGTEEVGYILVSTECRVPRLGEKSDNDIGKNPPVSGSGSNTSGGDWNQSQGSSGSGSSSDLDGVGWIDCGSEGEVCEVPRGMDVAVRYGKSGKWVYSLTKGYETKIKCDASYFFNTIIPAKCQYRKKSSQKIKCAQENGQCMYSSSGRPAAIFFIADGVTKPPFKVLLPGTNNLRGGSRNLSLVECKQDQFREEVKGNNKYCYISDLRK